MFTPPHCPNEDCARHTSLDSSAGPFFVRRGSYVAACRTHPVPRFRCKTCRREFSRQTFRFDYRDHRPDLNAVLLILFASGLGQRMCGRILSTPRNTIVNKFRKLGRHFTDFNDNLTQPVDQNFLRLQFDELETYEGRRNTRPLTLPVLIERESRFLVGALSAPIRPRGKMTEARLRAIEAEETRFGPREDQSAAAIEKVLARGTRLAERVKVVQLETDEKTTYPGFAKQAFGAERLVHLQTNSRLPRWTWNPLFPINHTEAIARDRISRLRRRSWLVSKKGCYLDLHMQIYMAHQNYVVPRFNRDRRTPAQHLGLAEVRMRPQQILSWRQDQGVRSLHPTTVG